MEKIKAFFSRLVERIKNIKVPKVDFSKIKFSKEKFSGWPLWLKIVLGVIAIYILGGIVFAVLLYKSCPNNGKTCLRDSRATEFSAKIYPYPAAWAGFNPVWAKDYFKQIDYIKHYSQKSGQELPDNKTLSSQVLSQMTDSVIIKKQANKAKIKVSKADINAAFDKIANENGGKEEVDKVLLDLYGMSEKDFRNLISDQLYREKVQNDLLMQIHAKHILIKDENKAKDVLAQTQKGDKSFEDLAKQYSEDTGSRDNGGDLGWFGRGTMVKAFEDAAFTAPVNQVLDHLVQTEFGFHIIKVVEKKGTVDMSFNDWLASIQSKYKIKKWIK